MAGLPANPPALARFVLARPEARFLITGGAVAVVYIGLTLLLSTVAGLPMPAAVAIGYALAVVLHFSMQRWFVFRHVESFALRPHRQVLRYAIVGVIQYATTLAATELLAPSLGISPQIAFLGVVAVTSTTGFLMLRHGVFHAESEPAGDTA